MPRSFQRTRYKPLNYEIFHLRGMTAL